MRDVDIVGAGITPFGKHPDATMSSLAATTIGAALANATCRLPMWICWSMATRWPACSAGRK